MASKSHRISSQVGRLIIKEILKRLPKNTPLKQIAKKTGYTEAYLSQITNYARIPEKYEVYENIFKKGLGLIKKDVEEIIVEAKITEAGIADPAVTLMLKEIPYLSKEEKQSIIDAFELVKLRRLKQKQK